MNLVLAVVEKNTKNAVWANEMLNNKALVSVLLGIIWSIPFFFENTWPIAALSLLFVVNALCEYDSKELVKYGFIVVFTQNIIAVYWMKALSPVAWILVAVILASECSLFCYLFSLLRKKMKDKKNTLWIIPFAWYVYEYTRGLGMFRWSWTNLGNWLTWKSENMTYASVVGLYGLSFFIMLFAVSLFSSLRKNDKMSKTICIFSLFFICGITFQENKLKSTEKATIRIVSNGKSALDRWDADALSEIREFYSTGSSNYKSKPQVILWPESAIVSEYPSEVVSEISSEAKVPILYGAFINDSENFHNVYGVSYPNRGHLKNPYEKRFLVPMGEFVIFRKLVEEAMPDYGWPVRDVSPGDGGEDIKIGNLNIGTLLCWEALFPGAARTQVSEKTDFLVIASNTSWFSQNATTQFSRLIKMRAIESGRKVVSVITGGGSSIVDINGDVLFDSPMGEHLFKNKELQIEKKDTVFNHFGDFLLLIPSLLICFLNIKIKS